MIAIAVTGGIACGKSLVGRILAENGFLICDADDLAHGLLEKGTAVYRGVIRRFGKLILNKDGTINRRRLGKRVFLRPAERAVLNSLIHPAVRERWEKWLDKTAASGMPRAVIVPLLYEIGAGTGWDAVVCVVASRRTQIRRLRERGLSEGEANQRLSAQMPLVEKIEKADYVIMNEGTEDAVNDQVKRVIARVLEE